MVLPFFRWPNSHKNAPESKGETVQFWEQEGTVGTPGARENPQIRYFIRSEKLSRGSPGAEDFIMYIFFSLFMSTAIFHFQTKGWADFIWLPNLYPPGGFLCFFLGGGGVPFWYWIFHKKIKQIYLFAPLAHRSPSSAHLMETEAYQTHRAKYLPEQTILHIRPNPNDGVAGRPTKPPPLPQPQTCAVFRAVVSPPGGVRLFWSYLGWLLCCFSKNALMPGLCSS